MSRNEQVAGSFRDPSGFVFRQEGVVYRQVNQAYKDEYAHLISSGLYESLAGDRLLIPHEETDGISSQSPAGAYKVLKPEQIPFISFPYEWSFSQLKDAALLTLKVQQIALKHGMTLKDCSAYNIQFLRGKPVFIDTLSFERYEEGMPWTPYRQFCQHFLAPLALMALVDVGLSRLFRVYIDGIPLETASRMLPGRTRWSMPLLLHIHTHAKSQKKHADEAIERKTFQNKMSLTSLKGLLDSLEGGVRKLNWSPAGTEWADYYSDDSYTTDALEQKKSLVQQYASEAHPETLVWDFGANTGLHTRLACPNGAYGIAFDVDPAAVEKNYLSVRSAGEENILPLVLDLTNPSPAIGWSNQERPSVLERGPADCCLALALIHHLAISNNVPLPEVARFFGRACNWLIVEFVPKEDKKVQKLLATREDVFPDYERDAFERHFSSVFDIRRRNEIPGSQRTLYLMQRK